MSFSSIISNLFKLEPPHAFAKDILARNALAFGDDRGRELINFCARKTIPITGDETLSNAAFFEWFDARGWLWMLAEPISSEVKG